MRVLIIDDHALFRVGLQGLLEQRGIEVADAVASGIEGIQRAGELKPDIVLLDLRMPDMGGLEVLLKLRENNSTIPVVMLTTSNEESDLIKSLRSGAQGYLLKDMEPDELISALGRIVGGETVVAEELEPLLEGAGELPAASAERADPSLAELTQRERDILCLLAEGQSNKAIARYLNIREDTVKKHVQSIMRKLEVKSRVEAAVIAVERNLCANRKGLE